MKANDGNRAALPVVARRSAMKCNSGSRTIVCMSKRFTVIDAFFANQERKGVKTVGDYKFFNKPFEHFFFIIGNRRPVYNNDQVLS
jgi:hypothetical protein